MAREIGYMVFNLGSEQYGIDVQHVQEIIHYEHPLPLFNMPDFIKGMLNLRGIIVPIIDLRIKYKIGQPVYNDATCIIVVKINGQSVGLVADKVLDILEFPEKHAAPDITGSFNAVYMTGIGVHEEQLTILIDIVAILSSEEIGVIKDIAYS